MEPTMYSGFFDHGAAHPLPNASGNSNATHRSPDGLRPDPAHFERLVDTLPAAAYTCDAEGLLTYYNQRAAELWGRQPRLNHPTERYGGAYKLFLTDGTPLKPEQSWMAKALQSGAEYVEREIVIERPNGDRVVALAHARPIRDHSGAVLGGANVLVDITDRETSQLALRMLEARLHQCEAADFGAATSPKRRILIADDQPCCAAHLATTLELMGHEVRVTNDGSEAVAIAAAFKPNVVFLNARLPHLDGYQAARRIRDLSTAGDSCLIALMNCTDCTQPTKSTEAGVDLHWLKPIDPCALERLVGAPAFTRSDR